MRIILKSLLFAAVSATTLGCPGPKEAADPRDILGEDLTHRGVDGTEGTDPSGEVAREPEGAEGRRPVAPLATKADCEKAARHLEELGVEIAIREETDPEKKAQLRAQKAELVANDSARKRIEESTRECLANATSRPEALCIARAQSESAIDQCAELD